MQIIFTIKWIWLNSFWFSMCSYCILPLFYIISQYKDMSADVFQNMCFKIFCNIQSKTPLLESLFNKMVGLWAYNFIKKGLQHRCCPVNIAKFLRTAFFIKHLQWLLLSLCTIAKPFPNFRLLFKYSYSYKYSWVG